LFSILSYFKRPYLYQRESQSEEVMDPVLIEYHERVANDLRDNKLTTQNIRESWDEMVRYVPKLRLELAKARRRAERRDPDADADAVAAEELRANDALLVKYYPEFLFRKEMTRRFVVDANSLVIDLIPGDGSALEPFKRVHRVLDAERARLENERRKDLIGTNNYEDPDTDRVIIVDRGGALAAGGALAPIAVAGNGAGAGAGNS
jgi:hypothetical protein